MRRMRLRLDGLVVLLAIGVYAVNRWLFSFDAFLPHAFAHYHLGDLCGGIIFPAYVNVLARIVAKRELIVSLPTSLCLSAICCVSWEVLAPLAFPHSTGDIIDACMYVLGGLIYLAARNATAAPRS